MRTTINLYEHLLREAKRRALQMNLTLGEFMSQALRAALAETENETHDEFHMVTFGPTDKPVMHEPADFHCLFEQEDSPTTGG